MLPSSRVIMDFLKTRKNISIFRKYQKARASLEEAIKSLSAGKISDDKKREVEAELRLALEKLEDFN